MFDAFRIYSHLRGSDNCHIRSNYLRVVIADKTVSAMKIHVIYGLGSRCISAQSFDELAVFIWKSLNIY